MKIPLLMGIVNVTPDSFSDGGNYFYPQKAIEHGLRLIEEGADILDIGGESTRPGSEPISADEEIKRILPVIEALAKTGKIISVDTRNAKTMNAALEVGASFLNDVSALEGEGSLAVATRSNVSVCLMHMKGNPQTMQTSPVYEDVVEEVFQYLKARIETCIKSGISKDRIYIDIGIGFGKTTEHNISLLRELNRFHELGAKLLLGLSRKKFIEAVAGKAQPPERLGGSIAGALWAAHNDIDILRVHDVFATRQALTIWDNLNGV